MGMASLVSLGTSVATLHTPQRERSLRLTALSPSMCVCAAAVARQGVGVSRPLREYLNCICVSDYILFAVVLIVLVLACVLSLFKLKFLLSSLLTNMFDHTKTV